MWYYVIPCLRCITATVILFHFINTVPIFFPSLTSQEVLRAPVPADDASPTVKPVSDDIWAMAWQAWLLLAAAATKRDNPTNAYITGLIDAVPLLYRCVTPCC